MKTKRTSSALRKWKQSPGDRAFDVLNLVFLALFAFVTLFPFWNLLVLSFNDATDAYRGNVFFWPREFTWYNYEYLFNNPNIFQSAFMSVLRTVSGTLLGVFCTIMLAYPLSRKAFVLRKPILILFLATMYISGGLIPGYMLTRSLGLINTFWVYIIPGLVSAWNLLIAKSFLEELPDSLIESAKIDGAGEMRILVQIIIPLSKPIIATLSLFIAVGHWNDWFTTMLYASDNNFLSTLQYELMKVLNTANQSGGAGVAGDYKLAMAKLGVQQQVSPNAIRASMTMFATVPILLVYPFLQKYFVQGFNIGAVKE